MASISLSTPSHITGRRFSAVPAPHFQTNICFPTSSASPPVTPQLRGLTKHLCRPGHFTNVLGIHSDASCQEIKSAYRKLAKLLHPDAGFNSKGGGATTDEFMRLHAAYATLSDPEEHAMYNVTLSKRRRREASLAASSFPDVEGRSRTWETHQCW